jgi:hypothetical protein
MRDPRLFPLEFTVIDDSGVEFIYSANYKGKVAFSVAINHPCNHSLVSDSPQTDYCYIIIKQLV